MRIDHASHSLFGRRELLLLITVLAAAFIAIGYQARVAYADGTFSLSAANYAVNEGDPVSIVINRSGGSQPVQVTVTVTDGSAIDGTDYVHPGPFSFFFTVPGSNTESLQISTIENLTPQFDRTFTVTISVPGGTTVSPHSSAIVTILDDDGPPTYSYQTTAASFTEGTSSAAVTVLRSGSTADVQQVDCVRTSGSATPGVDYTVVNGTATFGVGVATATCAFNILADAESDNGETIVLGFANATSGFLAGPIQQSMTITINEQPAGTLQFSSTSYSVNEGAGTASITVTRTGGSAGSISATCATVAGGTATAGVDYTTTSTLLTWTNGVTTSQTCSIPILNDGVVEGPETVNLQLTGANVDTPSTATLTIFDDDGTGVIQFTSATYTGAESGGPITVTVQRTGTFSGEVSVQYATSNGSATAGSDYTAVSGTLTWANGDSANKSFTVTPIVDAVTEGTETVNLTLSNVTGGATIGGTNPATLNITDSTVIPTVTNVNPGAGPITGGTAITITGTNFVGTPTVTVGGNACTSVVLVNSTTITCVTPAHAAGQTEVIVTTTNGSNVTTGTANDFTYTTGPTVTSITPNTGPAAGATIVTITGTNFTASGLVVRFGTVTATANFISPTQVVAVAPAQSAGVVDVTVQTPGGTSPNTAADDFTYTGVSVPAVTSLNPTSGPIGTVVVITGTGFTGATAVSFGGTAATYTINSPTQITATVPAGTPSGTIDVRVTGPGGQSPNTANDNFNNTSQAANITYTLYFRFTLIVWTGADNRSISAALAGGTAGTNNVSSLIGAIWLFNPQSQTWGGYFPGSEGVPGANNFTTFRTGSAYFISLLSQTGSPVTWTTSGQ